MRSIYNDIVLTLKEKWAINNPFGLLNQKRVLEKMAFLYKTRYAAAVNNIERSINVYRKEGMIPEKTLIGIPFYGRSFNSQALYQKYDKTHYVPYREIKKRSLSGEYQKNYDRMAEAPFLTHNTKPLVISYDNAQSIAAKINFVYREKLGGVIVWELSQDMGEPANRSLQQSLHEAIFPKKEPTPETKKN